jgi:NAD(P)-dependent dehydrogenase (short-subunit alcohol dehydrogenase family)
VDARNEDVDPHTVDRPGIPAGRPGHADEVAAVVALLADPRSAYVTGASYVVDGGMLLMGAAGRLAPALAGMAACLTGGAWGATAAGSVPA